MLKGKTVVLAVTGSIAAYKAAALASALVKQGAQVQAMMTENACKFIHPVTFETLTGRKCLVDTFDRNFQYKVEHVAVAKEADLCVIAPATANVIGKLAAGIADDMVTTTVLACKCKKIVAPAMNTQMYENPVVQENLDRLRRFGFVIAEPAAGRLACGDTGKGKMEEPEMLLEYIRRALTEPKDYEGLRVLVTAGPTQESLDPVRYLTNHSTGKMGYALARAAMRRGADVVLVSGPVALPAPAFVRTVPVVTAEEMFAAVKEEAKQADIVIKAAAVADYRPSREQHGKIKKKDGALSLSLTRNPDILAYLGEHRRPGQFLCGFSMETEDLLANSRKKLAGKHLDMIVANSLREAGAGFAGDTNVATILTETETLPLGMRSKEETAEEILTRILKKREDKTDDSRN